MATERSAWLVPTPDFLTLSDLAAAFSRVGGVLEAQGELEAAQTTFAENLTISRGLAEQDPSNADWQRDLAAALSRVGGVLEAQGELEAAQTTMAF
jgi:Flp pilus assembly protein TadD